MQNLLHLRCLRNFGILLNDLRTTDLIQDFAEIRAYAMNIN